MILAIDPGNEFSAFVVFDAVNEKIIEAGKVLNEELYRRLPEFAAICTRCCIEMIAAYGQVGASVLDTCVWIGVFAERYGRHDVEYIFRKTITTYITGSPRGNDSAIRTVLITRYGDGNTRSKQKGNILEGLKADMWQALAIAVYKSDLLQKRSWHGSSEFVKKG